MKSAPTANSPRRREILGRLQAAGFTEGRSFPRRVRTDEPHEPAPQRLRGVLQGLGGCFAAWGRYLSSRLDTVPDEVAQLLAALPDQRPPASHQEIRGCLEAQLGRSVEEAFQAFEPEPMVSSLRWQDHLARSQDGRALVVRVVHPALEKDLTEDLTYLSLFDSAVRECGGRGVEQARDDFAQVLGGGVDLTSEAEAWEILARDATLSPLIKVPRVERALSAQKVLTFEQLPGLTLKEIASSGGGLGARRLGGPAPGGPQAEQLAGRLCRAWLRQALCGGAFPPELRTTDIRILPNHQIAWTGGPWQGLPAAAQANLWEYVTATASQDPDRACTALLREMDAPVEDEEALRRRFRQLIPFRDGGREARDDLAGYLLLQWRIAVQEGYRPRSDLLAFYRGLGQLMRCSRQLAWSGDALREGLEGLQLMNGLNEWVQMADPAAMQQIMGNSLTAFLTLPQKLDDVLARATDGGANIKLQMVEPPATRRRKNASAMVIAALLAMVSVVLLAPQLSRLGLSEIWTERATTAAVTLLGVWVLMGVSRWS